MLFSNKMNLYKIVYEMPRKSYFGEDKRLWSLLYIWKVLHRNEVYLCRNIYLTRQLMRNLMNLIFFIDYSWPYCIFTYEYLLTDSIDVFIYKSNQIDFLPDENYFFIQSHRAIKIITECLTNSLMFRAQLTFLTFHLIVGIWGNKCEIIILACYVLLWNTHQ